jgi:hypothetical protein
MVVSAGGRSHDAGAVRNRGRTRRVRDCQHSAGRARTIDPGPDPGYTTMVANCTSRADPRRCREAARAHVLSLRAAPTRTARRTSGRLHTSVRPAEFVSPLRSVTNRQDRGSRPWPDDRLVGEGSLRKTGHQCGNGRGIHAPTGGGFARSRTGSLVETEWAGQGAERRMCVSPARQEPARALVSLTALGRSSPITHCAPDAGLRGDPAAAHAPNTQSHGKTANAM